MIRSIIARPSHEIPPRHDVHRRRVRRGAGMCLDDP
jgi:hypothetical protein